VKPIVLATFALLSLGVGTSFAQGKPPGTDPGTAPQAFPNEPYHTGTVFSEIFGRSKPVSVPTHTTAERGATTTNGG
jgi:hypothetical protein